MADSVNNKKNEKLSRRSFIKWASALAAAGAAGAAVGYGLNQLLRPISTEVITATTTKTETKTQIQTQSITSTVTTTRTVTAPPPTLSYKPPLPREVQEKVNAIIKELVDAHAGESRFYQSIFFAGNSGPAQAVVKNGVVIGVEPDDTVNPTIAREDAYLPPEDLQKGRIRGIPWGHMWVYPWQMNTPTRVLYPMKRTGPRGDPHNAKFVRISWDEAINIVADQIKRCKEKYGKFSVETGGVCFGHTEPWLTEYGVACNGGYGCASSANNMFAANVVLGSYATGSVFSDLLNSKLIVLWAYDPTTGGHNGYKGYLMWLSLAKEKGIPIIVIDIKYTNTAQTWADQWIPIRPCTDMAMMLAIANVLFKNSLYDAEYVSKYVEPTGFQKWKDYVLGKTAGPDGAIDRTPEWAAPICGVPAETITAFAKLYASSKPTCLIFGTGGQRIARGWNAARASIYLQAMTGNIGIPGGSAGGAGLDLPALLSTYDLPFQPGAYGIPDGGWVDYTQPVLHSETGTLDAILMRDDYQSGKITKEEYYRAIGNNINNPAPNIHMLLRLESGHAPGPTLANVNKAVEAVKKVDFFVTGAHHLDWWYRLADLILPMPEAFECTSYFLGTERGLMYVKKIVEPPGDVRDMNWFRMQVAKRLGVADKFAEKYLPGFQDVPYDKWEDAMQNLLKKSYEDWAAKMAAVVPNLPSWDELQKNPVVRADIAYPPPIPYGPQISQGQKFNTKSGLIEFYNSDLETFDLSKVQPRGYWGIGAPVAPMAIWEPPEDSHVDPKAEKYPLVMRDSHNRYTNITQGWANPMLEGVVYRHSVWINPADAKARGIVDGDTVEVYNDRGSIVLTAYVTSRQTPGSVFIYAHTPWKPDPHGVDWGGCTNVLNNDSVQVAACGQEATNALVEVRKLF
ncbi:MAG: molybdopterin-dependent oxidoreductase [Nitrososphaerales archaeon]